MDFKSLENMKEGKGNEYLDLTESVVKQPVQQPKEEQKSISTMNGFSENISPQVEPRKIEPKIIKKIKPKRKFSLVGAVVVILVLATVIISGYNFYILQGSNWECFTDKCVDYYDKTEWLENNCEDGICRFRYQNQDQSVLVDQLQDFPADHSIFCKSFSCDTKILRRAG